MRARGLARCEGDELDAAIRVECIRERLSERGEAADERLAIVKVCESLKDRVEDRGAEQGARWYLLAQDVP